MKFRWYVKSFLPEIAELEDLCFEFESWSEKELNKKLSLIGVSCLVCVNELEQIVGYAIYRRFEDQKLFLLMRLAVHPDYRRQKIASKLVERLKSKLNRNKLCKIEAVVEDKEVSVQKFFNNIGFVVVSIIENYKLDNAGYTFRLELRKCADAVRQ